MKRQPLIKGICVPRTVKEVKHTVFFFSHYSLFSVSTCICIYILSIKAVLCDTIYVMYHDSIHTILKFQACIMCIFSLPLFHPLLHTNQNIMHDSRSSIFKCLLTWYFFSCVDRFTVILCWSYLFQSLWVLLSEIVRQNTLALFTTHDDSC